MIATLLALALLAPPAAAPDAGSPAAPPVLEGSLALGRWKATDDPRDTSAATALSLAVGVAWPRLALEVTSGTYGPAARQVSGSECGLCQPDHSMRMFPLQVGARAYFDAAGQLRPFVTAALGAQWWREEGQPALGARRTKVTPALTAGAGLELASQEALAFRFGVRLHLTSNPYENDAWTSWELFGGIALRLGRPAPGPGAPVTAPPPGAAQPVSPDPAQAQPEAPRGPAQPTAGAGGAPGEPAQPHPPVPAPGPAPAAAPAAPPVAPPAWARQVSLGATLGVQRFFEPGRDYGAYPDATLFELRAGWRAARWLALEASAGWFGSTATGGVTCSSCAGPLDVTQLLLGGRLIQPVGPVELSLVAAVGAQGAAVEDGFGGGADWGLAVRPGAAVLWRLAPVLAAGVEGGWLWSLHPSLGSGSLSVGGPTLRAVVELSPWRTEGDRAPGP